VKDTGGEKERIPEAPPCILAAEAAEEREAAVVCRVNPRGGYASYICSHAFRRPPGSRSSFGGEIRWPSCGGHIGWGGLSTGPTPVFIAVVSPCRCEPLRARCYGGGGGGGMLAYVGNPRSEEYNPESRFFLAQFMNPCT